uniref:uncharacterized protein LOC100184284 n=1 Tax=Ciona intestinalis TaxID=7719 RepID=UPI000180D17C|nr:uncharacterized protein LOC100184284 [Ciona intestinalis]|eukprot:XP_002128638.1 uncharacterized protein LOC100184284 [Ciona intestinalis]
MASFVGTVRGGLTTITVALLIVMFCNYLNSQFRPNELHVLSAKREWDLFLDSGLLSEKQTSSTQDSFIQSDFVIKKISDLVSVDTTPKSRKQEEVVGFNKQDDLSGNFTFVLNELMAAIQVHNFYTSLWGCNALQHPQVKDVLYETKHNFAYIAEIKDLVIVQIAKADVDELITAKCGSSDADNSKNDLDRCFLLKNKKILQEAVVLMQISLRNIANLIGLCVERTEKSKRPVLSSAGVVLIKEFGTPVKMEQLKLSSWMDRLKICYDLMNLVHHFSNVPVGSIRLESWSPSNFVVTQQGIIKLTNFDQSLTRNEPFCQSDNDCLVNGISCRISCQANRCVGYNSKKNLYEVNKSFLSQLLRHNVPAEHSDMIFNTILAGVNSLKLTAKEVASAMQVILPHSPPSFKLINSIKNEKYNDNPAILSMKKLPDGSQVDSWENHESQVSINEVPGQFNQANMIEKQMRVLQPEQPQQNGNAPDDFHKIDDADFPGRYDYYCPRSKAEWGCVMSLKTVDEARQKCLDDPKCKAFVTIPHLRKEGWIIAILKSDNSQPVDHAGTTVYIRIGGTGGKSDFRLAGPVPTVQKNVIREDCLRDIIEAQVATRSHYENALMSSLGWKDFSEQQFQDIIQKSRVEDASTFKPARGKLANGGQMNINLNYESSVRPALFLAKAGPEEFHAVQMAVYNLDRTLGLYKTGVSCERRLDETELAKAGFPVDLGGNRFDNFRPLKQPDNSLTGVIVPKIVSRITVEHYISVPRLTSITSAVTPFSRKQWDDLEYLLLGFLAAVPVPTKGHQSIKGHLVHVKTDEAFSHNNNEYLSFLYNCQFPAHVIETLQFSRSHNCDLAGEITPPGGDVYHKVKGILDQNVDQLLQLVDQCINKFGESLVLYNSVLK